MGKTTKMNNDMALDGDYVFFDIETTGFEPLYNKIIEIGAVKRLGGRMVDRFSAFVNPGNPVSDKIEQLTGINNDMLMNAPGIEEVLSDFLKFTDHCVMVAHNAYFDMGFIISEGQKLGIRTHYTIIDTVEMTKMLLPQLNRHTLPAVAETLHVSLENHQRAVDYAGCVAEIFVKLTGCLCTHGICLKKQQEKEQGVFSVDEQMNFICALPSFYVTTYLHT